MPPDSGLYAVAPLELKRWMEGAHAPQLLDVRSKEERQLVEMGGVHIPMDRSAEALEILDPDAPVVVYCHHGIRSGQVAAWLQAQGFASVGNLTGGIDRWAVEIDPEMVRY